MSTPETSRFVRLRVDLVLEVGDEDAVARAALARIADDGDLSAEGQEPARGAVTGDTAEALAHLVDPFGLVGDVPGVELQQASWSSEEIDYDPDSPEWDLDGDGFGEDGFDGDGSDEASVAGAADDSPGECDK
ncbi:hypothetical protein [Streptomyces sp. NEAU-W12]|uniref:hypothetical protein n=1 Tax=Streptomyces sp. NEAU-W12 TaxID=2994668 RepID=UPI00224AF3E0|nr:hypothetical protein [Streptomyces sp. NEAU-W12]MCX2928344.1 hypothetical protein [Streptomyces sp. NEAU-W12]